jgi:hypothetical protein
MSAATEVAKPVGGMFSSLFSWPIFGGIVVVAAVVYLFLQVRKLHVELAGLQKFIQTDFKASVSEVIAASLHKITESRKKQEAE